MEQLVISTNLNSSQKCMLVVKEFLGIQRFIKRLQDRGKKGGILSWKVGDSDILQLAQLVRTVINKETKINYAYGRINIRV